MLCTLLTASISGSSEFAAYAKNNSKNGGGPPPSTPKSNPLLEAAASLIQDEQKWAEDQYDNTRHDTPSRPASPELQWVSCVVLQEGDFGKQPLQMY